MNNDIKYAIKNAIKAARELRYSKECIEALKNAKTLEEINRIMKKERTKGS